MRSNCLNLTLKERLEYQLNNKKICKVCEFNRPCTFEILEA